jgi:hypothetical protein
MAKVSAKINGLGGDGKLTFRHQVVNQKEKSSINPSDSPCTF